MRWNIILPKRIKPILGQNKKKALYFPDWFISYGHLKGLFLGGILSKCVWCQNEFHRRILYYKLETKIIL